jgi:predicted dithiol-disulfide oxidoreductase (DUF899 family)
MENNVVSHKEWLEARKELLGIEKELTKKRDELARRRQALPWEKVEKTYRFQGAAGPITLPELFGPHSQLIVYHFMFGPDWQQGCKSCSFWADGFDGIITHLNQRDVAMVCVSAAPLEKLMAFRQCMGWRFEWVSSTGTAFNNDFGVAGNRGETLVYNYERAIADAGELPGLSVFVKNGTGDVFHTYSCYARGLDGLNPAYQLLDLAPKGRDEDGLPYTMSWVKHHDLYGEKSNA